MKPIIKLVFFFVLIFPSFGKAQCDSLRHYFGDEKSDVIEMGGTVVEEMPQFPGGEEARIAFFKKNIRIPDNWRPDSITGKVFITFLVDIDGSIKYPCILRGLNPILDSIAIATIWRMPKWIPAKQRGVPVRIRFNLPIKFGLDNYQKK